MSRELDELLKKQKAFSSFNAKAYSEHVTRMNEKGSSFSYEEMVQRKERAEAKDKAFRKFSESLKNTLVINSITHVLEQVGKELGFNEHHYAIGNKMVETLVMESGADNLIERFKSKNVMLSSYAEAINSTFKSVIEANRKTCDNDDEDDICFTFDKDYASGFVDALTGATPDRVSTIVGDRVQKAVTNFVDQNTENKLNIENIYRTTKAKIEKTDDKEIKEQYSFLAKRKVNEIENSPKSLYGRMVSEMCESILKNDQLKKVYTTENGRLNMPKIFNDTQVMYAVIETANTMGVIDVDREYVKKIITDIHNN